MKANSNQQVPGRNTKLQSLEIKPTTGNCLLEPGYKNWVPGSAPSIRGGGSKAAWCPPPGRQAGTHAAHRRSQAQEPQIAQILASTLTASPEACGMTISPQRWGQRSLEDSGSRDVFIFFLVVSCSSLGDWAMSTQTLNEDRGQASTDRRQVLF
jgi:hypothetical protein